MTSKTPNPEIKLAPIVQTEGPKPGSGRGNGLPLALGIGIGIAAVLVTISIGLYLSSNLSRIDLSKPKYAEARNGVDKTSEETVEQYSIDGPINQQSTREAVDLLKKRRGKLREAGNFSAPVLSDEALGIRE